MFINATFLMHWFISLSMLGSVACVMHAVIMLYSASSLFKFNEKDKMCQWIENKFSIVFIQYNFENSEMNGPIELVFFAYKL